MLPYVLCFTGSSSSSDPRKSPSLRISATARLHQLSAFRSWPHLCRASHGTAKLTAQILHLQRQQGATPAHVWSLPRAACFAVEHICICPCSFPLSAFSPSAPGLSRRRAAGTPHRLAVLLIFYCVCSVKPASDQPSSAADGNATLTVADLNAIAPHQPAAKCKRKATPTANAVPQLASAANSLAPSAAASDQRRSKKAKSTAAALQAEQNGAANRHDSANGYDSAIGPDTAHGHNSARPVSALNDKMSLPDGQLGLQGGMAGLSPVKGPAPLPSNGKTWVSDCRPGPTGMQQLYAQLA